MIKKFFKWFSLFLLILSVGGLVSGCWRSAKYPIVNRQAAHHGEDEFISLAQPAATPFLNYLRMRLKEGMIGSATDAEIASVQMPVDLDSIYATESQPKITWIGHATALVQYQGFSFLTDPHLSDQASPLPALGAGPKRVVPPALRVDQLPKIDFVVISHNHYDHLDDFTVKAIGNQTHWYVPLGLKAWMLKRNIDEDNVTELDWWETDQFNDQVSVIATPSQHWSKRTPFDTNKTLWASWHIDINGFKTWFAGDTGYHQNRFKKIGNQLGPYDLALIPIGAYGPRYFMLPQHVDPEQAVQTHIDVKSEYSIGIHWGTFELTHESFLEPQQLLIKEMQKRSLSHPFITLKIGETQRLQILN